MNLRTINISAADVVGALAFTTDFGRTREGLIVSAVVNKSAEAKKKAFKAAVKKTTDNFVEEAKEDETLAPTDKHVHKDDDIEISVGRNMQETEEVVNPVVGTERDVTHDEDEIKTQAIETTKVEKVKTEVIDNDMIEKSKVEMTKVVEVKAEVIHNDMVEKSEVGTTKVEEVKTEVIDNDMVEKAEVEPQVIDITNVSEDEYFQSSMSRDFFLIKLSLIGAFNEIIYDDLVETVCDHKACVMTIVKRYDVTFLKTIEKPAIMIEDAEKAAVFERERVQARLETMRARRMAEIEARRRSLRLNLSDTYFRGEEPEMRDTPKEMGEDSDMRSDVPDDLREDEMFDRFEPPARRQSAARTRTPSKITHTESWNETTTHSLTPSIQPHNNTFSNPSAMRRSFVTPTETMASIRASVEKKYRAMPRPTLSFDERSVSSPTPSYIVEERPGMPAIIHVEDMPESFANSE
jgi:hypothetical protein